MTIHRGTRGGGGVTTIGDRNVFMAYVHVAHDCHVGNDTIFGNMATLGGHVTVEDFANVSAGSGVHQFCRVGRHAFIGGYSVVTKDALPFARTVGSRPARIFGANTIGLMRRGVPPDVIDKLKRSFRYLLQSKLNTTKRAAADRAGPVARLRRGANTCSTSSARRSAASSCAARRGAPKCSRTNESHAGLQMHESRSHEGSALICLRVLRAIRDLTAMNLGLIAGNGRFPFLVLDAARAPGHDVTVVAAQGRDLSRTERGRARRPKQRHPLDLARTARHVHQPAEAGRRDRRR